MIEKGEWTWMPHAGHFICGQDCRFHLATRIGDYIVSTVGEYVADSRVREIRIACHLNQNPNAKVSEVGSFEDIGFNRKYETMVFKAEKAPSGEHCCPWRAADGQDLDFAGYINADSAYLGHMAMCEKWAAAQ